MWRSRCMVASRHAHCTAWCCWIPRRGQSRRRRNRDARKTVSAIERNFDKVVENMLPFSTHPDHHARTALFAAIMRDHEVRRCAGRHAPDPRVAPSADHREHAGQALRFRLGVVRPRRQDHATRVVRGDGRPDPRRAVSNGWRNRPHGAGRSNPATRRVAIRHLSVTFSNPKDRKRQTCKDATHCSRPSVPCPWRPGIAARPQPDLPGPADAHGRAICAGNTLDTACARSPRCSRPTPASRSCRCQAGRLGHHRGAERDAGARPTATRCCWPTPACSRSTRTPSPAALRPGQELQAGDQLPGRGDGDGGARQRAGQQRGRVRRLDQGEPGKVSLRPSPPATPRISPASS
jgi:hypothetical protein